MTEKYLDFSFEKTNSAYMLFYERRTPVSSTEKIVSDASSEDNTDAQPSTSCTESAGDELSRQSGCASQLSERETKLPPSEDLGVIAQATTPEATATNETDPESELTKSNLETETKTRNSCDIVSKDRTSLDDVARTIADATTVNSQKVAINAASAFNSPQPVAISRLSKELEDWIWQDNRHFLQDRNIFEHTYFK